MSGPPEEAPVAHALARAIDADDDLRELSDTEKGIIVSVIEKAWIQAPGEQLIELRNALVDEQP